MSHDQHSSLASRRTLLKTGGLLAGAVVAGSLWQGAYAQETADPAATPAGDAGDLTILNFALRLELLEQAFYTQAANSIGTLPFLRGRLGTLITAIRDNEAAHVQTLTTTITSLGGTPVSAGTYRFPDDVFLSPIIFTEFAAALEQIGIGAYLGAIGQIKSRDIRRAAASIYGSETRHIALLRQVGGLTFSPRFYESPLSVEQTTQLIAPYVVG